MGVVGNFFSPLEVSILKQSSNCQRLFLNSILLKVPQKLMLWDLLRLDPVRGTKSYFLTPERYEEHARPFYLGVHPAKRCLRQIPLKVRAISAKIIY